MRRFTLPFLALLLSAGALRAVARNKERRARQLHPQGRRAGEVLRRDDRPDARQTAVADQIAAAALTLDQPPHHFV